MNSNSLIANTCWPARFRLRMGSIFLCFLALGMLLAVIFHKSKPTETEKQARVLILVTSPEHPAGEPAAAKIYRNASSVEEMSEKNYFVIDETGIGSKALSPGHRDFMVQILGPGKKNLGDPVHWSGEWPSEEGQTVTISIPKPAGTSSGRNQDPGPVVQSPPKPKNSSYPRYLDQPIPDQEVPGLTKDELRYRINAILAAAGYRFKNTDLIAQYDRDLADYFANYKRKPSVNSDDEAEAQMTSVQRANYHKLTAERSRR